MQTPDVSFQSFMDTEILPYLNTFEPLDYPMPSITSGTEGFGDILESLGVGIKNRFLDLKNIYRGIRQSNILFHKSEYGQYRKTHILQHKKVMNSAFSVLKDMTPLYKPADMAVKFKDTTTHVAKLVSLLNMPYTGYFLLEQSKDILKLVKRNKVDGDVYIRTRENIEKLSKYPQIAEQYQLVLNHYNSDHRNKTTLKFKFDDLFNNNEDFKETDKVIDKHHTLLHNANKIESVVLSTEKVFDDIVYHTQKKSELDKQVITTVAGIADVVSVVFGTYGYGISRLNELIHNHLLNLKSIGRQL